MATSPVLTRMAATLRECAATAFDQALVARAGLDIDGVTALGDVVVVPCSPRTLPDMTATCQLVCRAFAVAASSWPLAATRYGRLEQRFEYPPPASVAAASAEPVRCTVALRSANLAQGVRTIRFEVRESESGAAIASGGQLVYLDKAAGVDSPRPWT